MYRCNCNCDVLYLGFILIIGTVFLPPNTGKAHVSTVYLLSKHSSQAKSITITTGYFCKMNTSETICYVAVEQYNYCLLVHSAAPRQ